MLAGAILKKRYKVYEQVNNGGFGTIFSGLDLQTEAEVIIKVVNKHICLQNGKY